MGPLTNIAREMVEAGQWRAMNPHGADSHHVGFRLNALVSLLPNASWSKLVQEFLHAKDDRDELRVFVNNVLAEGWREEGEQTNEVEFAASAEPFSLDAIPTDVLVLTVGCDVQEDRLEVSTVRIERIRKWGKSPHQHRHHLDLGGHPEPSQGIPR